MALRWLDHFSLLVPSWHTIVGVSDQLAPTPQTLLHRPLEPVIQHMVQKGVRDQTAKLLRLVGFRCLTDAGCVLLEDPGTQPFVDHATDDAVLDPQVEEVTQMPVTIVSKYFETSASITHRWPYASMTPVRRAASASWADRPGLKPYERPA